MLNRLREVLEAFGISGKPEKLAGGQGQSVRVGDFVIKPIDEISKYSWTGSVLESISSLDIAISKPIRSKNGNFVEKGYGATPFIEGEFRRGKIDEKIKACQALHQLTLSIEQPEQWSDWYSPWQRANQVAWQEIDLPNNADIRSIRIIENIKKAYKPINQASQLIHSDLAGNILFNGSTPVIIDFSPEFRPGVYAEILIITDSIAWHQEPIESLWYPDYSKDLVMQLAIRATVFRLAVVINFYPFNHDAFLKELKNFQPILNILPI